MIDIGEFDHIFQTRLDSWTMMRAKWHELFSQREIDALQRAERTFQAGARTLVFLSFENRFASLGGLAAVTRHLPDAIRKAGERVVFLTPFHAAHRSIRKASDAGLFKEIFRDSVFHLCNFEGSLTCYQDTSADLPSYYLHLRDRFTAAENPYAYDSDSDELLLDSLAFAAAVPYALNKLGIAGHLVLHANDWETAPVAITSKYAVLSSVLNQARSVLTLHNSFDSPIRRAHKEMFFGHDIKGDTVLQCAIPFLNGPLTTVSTPFAHELRHDPLQRGIFTDHLQTVFSINPPIGIENGMFGTSATPFTPAVLSRALAGNFDRLLTQKTAARRRLLTMLGQAPDKRTIGSVKLLPDDTTTPVFFMSGRLDFTQKGFDSIFHAFAGLPRGAAKLFFCPSSYIDDGKGSLAFFEKLSLKCDGDIVIWPFRIPVAQYETILKGASFLLMPSFYEPFGAATEGPIHGTPVVARGTGGLWIQVNPVDGVVAPPLYGNILALGQRTRFPTGILYREECSDSVAQKQWRGLLRLPPEQRTRVDLFRAIVRSARRALEMSIDVFGDPELYGKMILNGAETVKSFTWERATAKYRRVYDAASSRGI